MASSSSRSAGDWHIIQRQHKAFLPPSNRAVCQCGAGQRGNMSAENSLPSPRALQGTRWEHNV
ncbi:uncharacterized protein V6R79_001549 [Siganus canaliculatus]